jgi:pyruvate dehydrogenase phosphatase
MFGQRIFARTGRLVKVGAFSVSTLVAVQHSTGDEVQCAAPSSSHALMTETSTATYNANDPIEDRFIVRNVCLPSKSGSWGSNFFSKSSPENTWSFNAIFDGHGGWQVAEMASDRLIPEAIKHISSNGGGRDKNKTVSEAILASFKAVEQEYLNKVRDAYRLGYGEVAKVGACALLAVRNENDLYLANCGDCRAVLGSQAGDEAKEKQNHVCSRLTRDHNARVPLELLTLQKEHPGEDDVVVCKNPHACYVKGRLQLTRALGDAYLKYAEFNAPAGSHRSRGRHIPEPFTPPYVKSTPDIAHVNIGQDDKFCVLATDGLWDFLSDQEAVDVVSQAIADGVPQAAAERLVKEALTKASQEAGMELQELLELPAGRQRRSRHDDTTVVVMFF